MAYSEYAYYLPYSFRGSGTGIPNNDSSRDTTSFPDWEGNIHNLDIYLSELTSTTTYRWWHMGPWWYTQVTLTPGSNFTVNCSISLGCRLSSNYSSNSYLDNQFGSGDYDGTRQAQRWMNSDGYTSYYGYNFYVYFNGSDVIYFSGGNGSSGYPGSSSSHSWSTTLSESNYHSTYKDADGNPTYLIGLSCDATNQGSHCMANMLYSYCKTVIVIHDDQVRYQAPTCTGNASVTAISGTTVTVRVPSWTNGTESATATIVCSNYSSGTTIDTKTITSSNGGTVTFTGLENGVRYRFRVTISDGTTSLSITASDGNSPNARTYACAVTDIDTSTCRIRFTAKPTAGSIQGSYVYESATITYTITGSTTATGTTSAGESTLTLNGFTHNTTHTISIYITGVTDTNGNYDATDSDSDSAVTKTLSLTGEVGECTMTTIETSWQALVDGSAQNADNLSGDYYTFCTSSTSSHNHYPTCETTNGSGYIKSETTPTCTVPTYSSNKTIVFENLTYYCQYSITVYITDGTNCVSYSLTAATVYPYARIYYNGAWYKAFVYVYDGGWNLSIGNVYDGSWRVFNGMST